MVHYKLGSLAAAFDIHQAHATRDGNILTLALAGTVDNSHAYLILSLDETPSRQDVELGLTGVYAEWNDQAHSGYEVIKSSRWSGTDLTIGITEVGQERGIPEVILLRGAGSHLGQNDQIIVGAILAPV